MEPGPTWRGRPGSTGGHRFGDISDKSGGTVSVGAPERGSTEVDPPGGGSYSGCGWSGMNGGGIRVPAPALPLLRQDRQSAGVATPTRMDADRHGGFRTPEARLPGKGTRLASHVFAEARDKDVNSDRDLPWSPAKVLVDTVARLQRDLNDMRAESRYL